MPKESSPRSTNTDSGMEGSTTPKPTREEQCVLNSKSRSEKKRQAAFAALQKLKATKPPVPITKSAVARLAHVSLPFIRAHPDLVRAIEEAEQALLDHTARTRPDNDTKDHVIAALRRRLDDVKQELAAKDAALREKQREIDLLYGKLASREL